MTALLIGYARCSTPINKTSPFLADMLRTGRAGSNTAADHISVLADAIAQVPAAHRTKLLVRSDGAGASHDLLDWLTEQGKARGRQVEYSVGYFGTLAPLAASTGTSTKDLMHRLGHVSADVAPGYQHAASTRDSEIARALNALVSP